MKRLLILLALAICVCLAGCSSGGDETVETPELIPFENWQSYVIMRPDNTDGTTVDAAVGLKKAIEDKLGTTLPIATDWVKRGEETPTGTLEILVGATNRPESDKGLRYHDYTVEFTGGRLVINGGSGAALTTAVEWYIDNCIGEGLSIPSAAYTVKGEYPYGNVSINGVPLKDYTMYMFDMDGTGYTELKTWIAENTGYLPENGEEHVIRFGTRADLNMEEISVTVKDGDLWLETSEYGWGRTEALNVLFDLVKQRESDTMTLNERVVVPMEGFATITAAQLADYKKQAADLKAEILSSPNMEIPKDAPVYYISEKGNDANDGKTPATAWKTIAHMAAQKFSKGTYICFERGGFYRGKFNAQTGVTYTAYGEGDKPVISGSPFNGSEHGKWTEIAENIWEYSEKFDKDVGGIVFENGDDKVFGIKCLINYTYSPDGPVEQITKEPFKGIDSMLEWKEELRFWHDHGKAAVNPDEPRPLYLYCSKGNPADVYESIEFLTHGNVIRGGNDVTVNNLCVKHTGSHGIGAGTSKNLTVTWCEIGDIGGSHLKINADGRPSRYGNGVEIYGGCENFTIDHCYVYECYDAGITHQLSSGSKENIIMDGVFYTNNLIENCIYNIEYFLGTPAEGSNPTRYMNNVHMKGNILLNAGYGWGEQRPDKTPDAHIKGWDHMNTLEDDFVIEDNLFLLSKHMMIHIGVREAEDLPILKNNVFVQHVGGKFGRFAQNPTSLMMYTYDTVTREELADNTYYIANIGDEITLD